MTKFKLTKAATAAQQFLDEYVDALKRYEKEGHNLNALAKLAGVSGATVSDHKNGKKKDKVSKGRQAKGSKNGRAKLTENQVQEILESPHNSPQILAERFGVSVDTIRKIRNGQRWNRTQIVPAQNLSNSSSPQLIDNKVIKVPPARFELATHGLGSHAASSITVQGNKD